MQLKVITNNPQIRQLLRERQEDCQFIDAEEADAVLLAAQQLIMAGWRLAADPLQGYYTRYNPFHTVFLQNGGDDSPDMQILRLQHSVEHLHSSRRPPIEKTPRIRADYQALDYSLACSTMALLGDCPIYDEVNNCGNQKN